MVPETVDPDEGDVLLKVGGVLTLETVTVTALEVVAFPAASRARAVSVCEPVLAVVVFQETEYGALVSSAPRLAPSSLNWTPATPMLSEAAAATVMVPETVDPDEGDVTLTVGGVVSGGGPLDTVTVTGSELHRTPRRSRPTAVSVWEPFPLVVVSQETEYGAAVSSAPRLAPSSLN
jgi:hypothetical protein